MTEARWEVIDDGVVARIRDRVTGKFVGGRFHPGEVVHLECDALNEMEARYLAAQCAEMARHDDSPQPAAE